MLYTRKELMEMEEKRLKPYAVSSKKSKGKVYKSAGDEDFDKPPRTVFQKDRDKIMHCRAFRRLQGKTQVFVAHYGDHFRTRLTHSIEVAQISRDLARNLGLNEDLAESVALAHDLGHTPFGHSGQDALNECMKKFGPGHGLTAELAHFEHNEQSLRIVDKLENIYPNHRGLNLSHEVREGMMKHQTSWDNEGLKILAHPSLEGQLVNLADEIAYNNHDVDDGLRAGLLTLDELAKLELWQLALEHTRKKYGTDLSERHLVSRTVSAMISIMIDDVLSHSSKLIENSGIKTLEDVYSCNSPLISFSPEMLKLNANLKSYLARTFYASEQVLDPTRKGQDVIHKLFEHYLTRESEFVEKIRGGQAGDPDGEDMADREYIGKEPVIILIKDYIAGMTDEFASTEYGSV